MLFLVVIEPDRSDAPGNPEILLFLLVCFLFCSVLFFSFLEFYEINLPRLFQSHLKLSINFNMSNCPFN